MAFQFVGDEFEYIEEESESTVLAYLGYDSDADASYFAAVTLSPFDDYVEYTFTVIRHREDNDEPFTSGLATKGFFEEADRKAILSLILRATELLLNWKEPPLVDRCTSDADLQPKALVKHDLVSEVFKKCGYKVTDCGDWNGQKLWKAERVEGADDQE